MPKYLILKNIRLQYIKDNSSDRLPENLSTYIAALCCSDDFNLGLEDYIHFQPDIIIVDIQEYFSNCLDIVYAIKAQNPEQIILISTTFSEPELLTHAVEAGIDDYVLRPLELQNVLDKLTFVTNNLLSKKNFKQQFDYLQIMMDSNPNMIFMVTKTDVVHVNKTLQKFVGYKPAQSSSFNDFCMFNYFQSIDDRLDVIHSREALIQYFIDYAEQQHIVHFHPLNKDRSSGDKNTFVISMTHQQNTDYYIFSLADISVLANRCHQLEQSAGKDKLTGIDNRETYEFVIERYIDRSKINNEPFVLIFFDIDHFKSINDHYGHDVGDQVLITLTKTITKNIRRRDFFARWGGEEFIILLRGSTLKDGIKTAECLRQSISELTFEQVKHITCSFSVVKYTTVDTADSLLKRADIVLYRAKASGRNCVRIYEIEQSLNKNNGIENVLWDKRSGINSNPLILIADDDYMQRVPMRSALELFKFQVEEAENGKQTVEMFKQFHPDLIILDVLMPEMDGFEACRQIRQTEYGRYLPILMLTGLDDVDSINQAYNDGATDFITKPVNWTLLSHKIRYLLRTAEIAKNLLEREIELLETQHDIIDRLAKAAEYRDSDTGYHIARMSQYSYELAKAIGLNEDVCEILLKASPLHDVGKLGISDHILLKKGKLEANEFEIIKTHASIGAELLSKSRSPLMEAAHIIALTHHEKWDGSGYPNQLKGENIHIFGRICAITDVFDALTSERPYKKAWTIQTALERIKEDAGSHFDPHLVDVFIGISERIIEINHSVHS